MTSTQQHKRSQIKLRRLAPRVSSWSSRRRFKLFSRQIAEKVGSFETIAILRQVRILLYTLKYQFVSGNGNATFRKSLRLSQSYHKSQTIQTVQTIILEMQLTKIFQILTGSDCVIIQQVLRNQTPKTSPYFGGYKYSEGATQARHSRIIVCRCFQIYLS